MLRRHRLASFAGPDKSRQRRGENVSDTLGEYELERLANFVWQLGEIRFVFLRQDHPFETGAMGGEEFCI